MQESRFVATLRALYESGARFVLVGGLAAVLHGAPIQTYDIDIVYSRKPEDLQCLLTALGLLDAIFRMQPERRLRPNLSHLSGAGHLNLLTRGGPLDLLATVGRHLGYDELRSQATEMEIAEGLRIPVLNLETLIRLKEELRGEKDIAVLPVLRRTLEEIRRKGGA